MINKLIGLGLVTIPFIWWSGYGTREPKMALALVFALALSLLALYKQKLTLKNPFLLGFMGFLALSFKFVPKIVINNNPASFWIWKPMLFISIFFMMLTAVASVKITKRDINRLFDVMVWVGFIMSLYAICQFFGFHQFFRGVSERADFVHVPSNMVGGTLGHPTILAPFIAMIIPFALYLRKYVKAIVIILAVILTQSNVAMVAMAISLLFLLYTKRKCRIYAVMLIILLIGICCIGVGSGKITGSGRLVEWPKIIKNVVAPSDDKEYSYTGYGMGSYPYIYALRHGSKFTKAHNEYIELFSNTGLIGISLFLLSIGYMFYINLGDFFARNKLIITLLSSFICIALCAGGTFIFQTGASIYYSIIVVGLLHNEHLKNEEN